MYRPRKIYDYFFFCVLIVLTGLTIQGSDGESGFFYYPDKQITIPFGIANDESAYNQKLQEIQDIRNKKKKFLDETVDQKNQDYKDTQDCIDACDFAIAKLMAMKKNYVEQQHQNAVTVAGAQGTEIAKGYVNAVKAIMTPQGIFFVGGATVFATTAFFSAKSLVNLVAERLGRPRLALDTSIPTITDRIHAVFWEQEKQKQVHLHDLIFSPQLAEEIANLAQSTLNGIQHGVPLRNILLYGPPGTGKTAIAKLIARLVNQATRQGMDYIYFPASNLDQFPLEEAIQLINDLFSYAHHYHKKLMIIIDECELFFAHRGSNLTDKSHKMLTTMLALTGQPSSDIMLVGITNRPKDFDEAALSRFDDIVYVGMPQPCERMHILEKYIQDYLVCGKNLTQEPLPLFDRLLGKIQKKATKLTIQDEVFSPENTNWLLDRLDGFSGRDIEKLVIAFQSTAYKTASYTATLTLDMMKNITERRIAARHTTIHD